MGGMGTISSSFSAARNTVAQLEAWDRPVEFGVSPLSVSSLGSDCVDRCQGGTRTLDPAPLDHYRCRYEQKE